jgi:hypothetical protein
MMYYILGLFCALISGLLIWMYKKLSAVKLDMNGPKHYPFFGSLFEFLNLNLKDGKRLV